MRIETGFSERAASMHGIRLTRTICIRKSCSNLARPAGPERKTIRQHWLYRVAIKLPFRSSANGHQLRPRCSFRTRRPQRTIESRQATEGNTDDRWQIFTPPFTNWTRSKKRSSPFSWRLHLQQIAEATASMPITSRHVASRKKNFSV